MAAPKGVMSDKDVMTRVNAKAQEAVGWFDSRLSRERQRVLGYYNGEYPKRQHEGASSYVSTDVYDGVEMMKAQLLEVFSGGEQIVRFDPDPLMDPAQCELASHFAQYVFFRENDGFRIMEDTIHDGLMARVGIAMVHWDECCEYRDEEFDSLDTQSAMALAGQGDVDEFDADLQDDGSYKGSLTRKLDRSTVKVEVVPPEEFLIAPRQKSIQSAAYAGRRTLKTRASLIEDGYSKKIVDSLHYSDGKDIQLSPEAMERNKPIETAMALDDATEPEQELITVYESYVRMQIDPSKGTRLYRFVHAADQLLEKQEVDRIPFIAFVPLPVPHMFQGNNYAARIIPYQNARTILTRGILDHTAQTTNPRWQVVKGGLINPNEMKENRLGGIVNVRTPESVTPLAQPSLNPFIYQTLQLLQENKESSTGISSLSQGLNKDAISSQNSSALVDQMVTLSAQRQKIIARNLAYGFLVPLFTEIVRIAIQNQKSAKVIEVNGQPLQIDPKMWSDKARCSVSVHLGYGERDQAIQQMTQTYAGMAQDPGMQRMFGEQQRYNMATDIMKMRKWGNAQKYIANPAQLPKPQPPQPDPIKMIEAQAKDKSATADMIGAQTDAQSKQNSVGSEAIKLHQNQQKLMLNAAEHDRAETRKDVETANRIHIANREMDLAEDTSKREAYLTPSKAA